MPGGQFSPTTPVGDLASTAPYGNIDPDFDIPALAQAAGATYTARGTAYHVAQTTELIDTDYVDIYMFHRVPQDVTLAECAEAMADLMKKGKIRSWAMSRATAEQIREANAICPLAVIQNESVRSRKRMRISRNAAPLPFLL